MGIGGFFLDVWGYIFSKIKGLILFIIEFIYGVFRRIYEKFLEVGVPEKAVFINLIFAFLATVMPVSKFYIFEGYKYSTNSNPLAVYMIGISIIMYITIYFRGLYVMLIRVILNMYYLFWIIYLPLAGELTKADPYEITFGYYLNILVPIVFAGAGLVSYFNGE